MSGKQAGMSNDKIGYLQRDSFKILTTDHIIQLKNMAASLYLRHRQIVEW